MDKPRRDAINELFGIFARHAEMAVISSSRNVDACQRRALELQNDGEDEDAGDLAERTLYEADLYAACRVMEALALARALALDPDHPL